MSPGLGEPARVWLRGPRSEVPFQCPWSCGCSLARGLGKRPNPRTCEKRTTKHKNTKGQSVENRLACPAKRVAGCRGLELEGSAPVSCRLLPSRW